ncbi:MAG: DUF2920 family protein [Rhodospirillales bacterium]|nr:DUF2920 family protein [Rhodospirillales bacterium]
MPLTIKKYEITAPHPDIELGTNRNPIVYRVFGEPDNAPRDVLFFIYPYGMSSDSPYVQEKLMPALTAMGFLGVVVDYFGSSYKVAGPGRKVSLVPPDGWVEGLVRDLQLPAPTSFGGLMDSIRAKGCTEIPRNRPVKMVAENEYHSFGWIPALDHVQVYGDLCRRYNLKPKHVALFGSSFGGYVATMIAKIMPDSFSFLIENSGFVKVELPSINNDQTNHDHAQTINGVKLHYIEESPWEIFDTNNPNYFGPAHAAIRDVRIAEHFEARPIPVVSYHSRKDEMIPIGGKREMWSIWNELFQMHTNEIDGSDVDGRLFKTTEHGMDASLIGMAEHAFSIAEPTSYAITKNDFERGTVRTLSVPGGAYEVAFNSDYSINARMIK